MVRMGRCQRLDRGSIPRWRIRKIFLFELCSFFVSVDATLSTPSIPPFDVFLAQCAVDTFAILLLIDCMTMRRKRDERTKKVARVLLDAPVGWR